MATACWALVPHPVSRGQHLMVLAEKTRKPSGAGMATACSALVPPQVSRGQHLMVPREKTRSPSGAGMATACSGLVLPPVSRVQHLIAIYIQIYRVKNTAYLGGIELLKSNLALFKISGVSLM